MNLSCTTKAIKYLMFAFNFIFVITGIILIAVGATIHKHYTDYEYILDGKYFSLPNLLIATGTLIFIISFLGCYGALKESWLMLMAFSVLLGVIFIFEFSAGIAGYVLRDKTSSYLEKTFYDTIPDYNVTKATAFMWDTIQRKFQCCGVLSPDDWITYLNKDNYDLPVSCCPDVTGAMGKFNCNNYKPPVTSPTTAANNVTSSSSDNMSSSTVASTESSSTSPVVDEVKTTVTKLPEQDIPPNPNKLVNKREVLQASETTTPPSTTSHPYSTGCEAAFGAWVKDHAINIGAVGFALAVIQIVGIIFACHLSRQLKNRYYST